EPVQHPSDAEVDARRSGPARAHATPTVVPAGPEARRLARELGVDLSQGKGSAPGGRVTQEDVKAYVRNLFAGASGALAPSARQDRALTLPAPKLPDFEHWGPIERKPLDSVRRKTAEHMTLAWSLIPHVTQHDQADITDLEAFRNKQG